MSELITSGLKQGSLFRFLQQELRVFPGRYNAMLRYLLSSVVVIVISMALNVPQLSYSLLVVFFATQHNIVLTSITFSFLMIAQSVAVVFATLMLKSTSDYTMFRPLFTAATLMMLLYLMRSSNLFEPFAPSESSLLLRIEEVMAIFFSIPVRDADGEKFNLSRKQRAP